jgi:hypothetical protein
MIYVVVGQTLVFEWGRAGQFSFLTNSLHCLKKRNDKGLELSVSYLQLFSRLVVKLTCYSSNLCCKILFFEVCDTTEVLFAKGNIPYRKLIDIFISEFQFHSNNKNHVAYYITLYHVFKLLRDRNNQKINRTEFWILLKKPKIFLYAAWCIINETGQHECHWDNGTFAGQGVSSGDKLGHVDSAATDDFGINNKLKLRVCVKR